MTLTLEEFRATRRTKIEGKDWCDDNMPGRDTCETLEYSDMSCWIAVIEDGNYYLIIGNDDQVSSDLARLEEILYRDWYLSGLTEEGPTRMTPDQAATIDALRRNGFAVVVFNPDELRGVAPSVIEDLMVSWGNDALDDLKDKP